MYLAKNKTYSADPDYIPDDGDNIPLAFSQEELNVCCTPAFWDKCADNDHVLFYFRFYTLSSV